MKQVVLSFDLEEFDMPLEYGTTISFQDQLKMSQAGTEMVLNALEKVGATATFFSTYVFAKESEHLLKTIVDRGHEIGSHSYAHSEFHPADFLKSKQALEAMGVGSIDGFRMPRMMPVDHQLLQQAGYLYDASINPTYLPGRYNNFFEKRSIHRLGNLWNLPAAATPLLRVPLFWLSFHQLPLWFYKFLCRVAFFPDNYIVLYFHPWEFVDLKGFGLPAYLTRNCGPAMVSRFDRLLSWMTRQGYAFTTCRHLVASHDKLNPITKGHSFSA